jgi:hypothetical protein
MKLISELRAELGRLPLEFFIKTQTSLYLLRLNNENINPLLKEAFHLSKILDSEVCQNKSNISIWM